MKMICKAFMIDYHDFQGYRNAILSTKAIWV